MFTARPKAIFGLLAAALAISPVSRALAYTPQSPEVQAAVDKGIAYIQKNFGKGQDDRHLGGYAICALACLSHSGNPDHPLVKQAVAEIRKAAKEGLPSGGHANYSLGIALIFLGTLDPLTYRTEVEALLKEIYKNQQKGGGWSYPGYATGDTSQSQYACLGMWMAHRQGIKVDQASVERACNWWIRTQDPSGAFQYQGQDPGGYTRVKQQDISASLTAAGVGSLYVCGELLGFIDDPKKMKLRQNLPPAFRPVIEDSGSIAKVVDQGRWQQAVKDGDQWLTTRGGVENVYKGAKGHQQYYYMYAIERYWAFRELAIKNVSESPPWYNVGVEYCLKNQKKADGSWESGEQGATIDTAFAVLFLLRSSKKTVTQIQIQAGRLTGGKGLQADMSTAKQTKTGRIVTADSKKATSELLAMLDDPDAPQSEFVSDIPEKIVLSKDPKKRTGEVARLRRLIINGGFQARLTAAKTLGTVRDLENGPYLIFALSDPDRRIVRAARDSLRFVSRKPDGFKFVIPDGDPRERIEKPLVLKAQQDWTKWLLSVKPDAELIE